MVAVPALSTKPGVGVGVRVGDTSIVGWDVAV